MAITHLGVAHRYWDRLKRHEVGIDAACVEKTAEKRLSSLRQLQQHLVVSRPGPTSVRFCVGYHKPDCLCEVIQENMSRQQRVKRKIAAREFVIASAKRVRNRTRFNIVHRSQRDSTIQQLFAEHRSVHNFRAEYSATGIPCLPVGGCYLSSGQGYEATLVFPNSNGLSEYIFRDGGDTSWKLALPEALFVLPIRDVGRDSLQQAFVPIRAGDIIVKLRGWGGIARADDGTIEYECFKVVTIVDDTYPECFAVQFFPRGPRWVLQMPESVWAGLNKISNKSGYHFVAPTPR